MSTLQEDGWYVAELLIHLQKYYPDFINDVDPDDPDLNFDIGFPTYEKLLQQSNPNPSCKLNVSKYLKHYQIKHRVRQKNDSTFYYLDACIFDESHRNNDAAVIQTESGMILYQCFHSSCQGRQWREARQMISGDSNLKYFLTGQ